MEQSLGKRIAELRKQRHMTQEEMASALNLSGQAVSKWENDQSCPDIAILGELADLLGVTVDELLRGRREPEAQLQAAPDPKDVDRMIMRIVINSADGDKVRVNLPLAMIRAGMDIGASMKVMGENSDALSQVDFAQILSLARVGVVGRLVEIESANGDTVEIWVEG